MTPTRQLHELKQFLQDHINYLILQLELLNDGTNHHHPAHAELRIQNRGALTMAQDTLCQMEGLAS